MAEGTIVSDERLHNYLHTYAESINLKNPKFRITEACNKGDNYVSLVCRVTLEGVKDGEAKKIELILKTTQNYVNDLLPSNKVTKMFQREAFFYREVLSIFKETLKDRGGIVNRFPILYDVRDEPGKEILMLENLSPDGFVMAKSKIMDYPHLNLTLRCLGELHAYSFITRVANPTGFEKLKQMDDPIFSEQPTQTSESSEKISKLLQDIVLEALENEDKHYSERYERFKDSMPQSLFDVIDGKAAEPYAVVNHGDSWTNNILFKYDQEKNPCDLRFIDLQVSRYASPVLDLVYVLFCCCTQETRSQHFDQVIREYYETLSVCIKKAGYDPNILFPYEILCEHLIKFGKYAAAMATYTIHIFTNKDVEIKDTYNENLLKDRVKNDSLYRNMLIGTFKDLVDRNYI